MSYLDTILAGVGLGLVLSAPVFVWYDLRWGREERELRRVTRVLRWPWGQP